MQPGESRDPARKLKRKCRQQRRTDQPRQILQGNRAPVDQLPGSIDHRTRNHPGRIQALPGGNPTIQKPEHPPRYRPADERGAGSGKSKGIFQRLTGRLATAK